MIHLTRHALALSLFVGAALAQSGAFTVLSFNVAGLPAFLESNGVGDKETNSVLMGAAFAAGKYDLIHVQEDFNYHDHLNQDDNHPYKTKTSGGVPFGSGLNTLSNYNWVQFNRITWDKCSDASEWDCLTPKGFTFMRWNPAPNVLIDVYNVHTDAGHKSGDFAARASNLNQVANYIAANSQGNAVIVFGDTNTLYSRTGDTISTFVSQAGLTDAWVQLVEGGVAPAAGSGYPQCQDGTVPADTSCEVLDKILYRGSSALTLTATTFSYETTKFLTADGQPLSDHNPVSVGFSWSLTA